MIESKGNILIIEDEKLIAADIKKNLEKNGYKVDGIVNRGEDALKIIDSHKPDLILMDVMLHGQLSGIETAERILKTNKVPIIYLTALTDDETFLNANITKPSAYLVKPFKTDELLKVIEKVIGH